MAEAREACQKLGIQTVIEYLNRYHEDVKLHAIPSKFYSDYPGAKIFFVFKEGKFYMTWFKASAAVQNLGITRKVEYELRYKEDPKLPCDPWKFYSDYPGARVFFRKHYLTWHEASFVAHSIGIKNMVDYQQRYHEDSRLPGVPWSYFRWSGLSNTNLLKMRENFC